MVSTAPKSGLRPAPSPPKPFAPINSSTIEPEAVKWLWWPYIPAGKLTIIEGDPSVGKSWVTCAVAAAVSNGVPLPGQNPEWPRKPGKVLMISAEDGFADTIVPRLLAMGANRNNIDLLQEDFMLNPEGIGRLEATMRALEVTIVFIDPLVAFLDPEKVDMNKATDVRNVMKRLMRAAERTGCAVVVVRHFRKAESDNSKYKGQGSIDFFASVRSVMQAFDLDGAGPKVLKHVKHNLSPEGMALGYEIVNELDPDGDPAKSRAYFRWLDDDEWEWPKKKGGHGPAAKASVRPKSEAAKDFLVQQLSQGPRPAVEVRALAHAEGFVGGTLDRAKQAVVESYTENTIWMWKLRVTLPFES